MPRALATDRLRRLLAMIPWILERGEVTIEEIAERFAISTAQVIADVDLASMIGIPPYTADCQIDMYVDENRVHAFAGYLFTRPPRLSVAEGFAVLAAGRALLAVPGATGDGSALEGAMAKLEAVLGRSGGLAVDVHVPPDLVAVRRAVEEGQRLDVDYWSAWRDELTTRTLDPRVVFERGGRWYVGASSPQSGELRHYRIDRIRKLRDTGERFTPRPTAAPDQVFDPGADAVEVIVDAPAPQARWVAESYPCHVVEAAGRLRITLRVVGTAWLERLLLRLGPDAHVMSPANMADVGRLAAARVLAAYAAPDETG
jgi:proteasome accessory factor C